MFKLVKVIAQRLGLGVLVLFAVSLIIFLGVELLPGDLCQDIQGQAATPETVKKFVALGAEVMVETGAGTAAHMADGEFQAAGAAIATDPIAALAEALELRKGERRSYLELLLAAGC